MELRDSIGEALKQAMRDRDTLRLSTLRLMSAAIKDRDIARRGEGLEGPADGAEILSILGKMVKQRQESARAYEEGGRLELAGAELAEIGVIETFLPRQLSAQEAEAAVGAAIAATGATGLRDIGRVMAELKARHAGQLDFGAAGAVVRARLSGG